MDFHKSCPVSFNTITVSNRIEVIHPHRRGKHILYLLKIVQIYTLPHSLRKIGDSAFEQSYFYETVLPDSLEEIGKSAFIYCTMRDSLTVPNSVKTIGNFALAFNYMKKAVLPQNLERIGNGLFKGEISGLFPGIYILRIGSLTKKIIV